MIYTKEARDERSEFLYGAGCASCAQTGYLGRMGLYEILYLSEEIRMLLMRGASTAELRAQALKEGMITLLRDGMLKVKANQTTPSEVLRNAYTVE
jgi:general secretion pathway protein E